MERGTENVDTMFPKMEDLSSLIDHTVFSEVEVIEVGLFPDLKKGIIKREAKPETWRRNVIKRLRAEGKEYVNARGKVCGRVQGPDCQCRFKCYEKIPNRHELLTKFNELADKQKQDTYLLSCISTDHVHRRRPRTDVRHYCRKYSHTYHIYVRGKRLRICQKAFASLHGVSKKRIQLLATKRGENGNQFFIPEENRGKHGNRVNRMSEDVHKNLLDHFASFPHRSTHNGDGKKYLSPSLSIRQMYQLYLEKYEMLACDERSESEWKPKVSYNYFLRFFRTNCNLRFAKPRTSTCDICERIERELGHAKTSSIKLKLTADKSLHLATVALFLDDMKEKIRSAEKNKHVECLCFDFYQSQPLPKVPTADVAYHRQLWVYIFCIYSMTRNTAKFYIYDELIGRKSANEVVSLLNHYIEKELPDGVKILNLYSDNCVSQNKNPTVMQYLYLLVQQHKSIRVVNHRFPQPGHSLMACHRAFDDIERNMKKIEAAYIPDHYAEVIANTSETFSVVNVTESMIKNYINHLEDSFEKYPDSSVLSQYCIFHYSRQTPNVVKVSLPAVPEVLDELEIVKCHNPKIVSLNPEEYAYAYPLPVSFKKYSDVQSLLAKYCPLEYLSYYAMVPAPTTQYEDMCKYTSDTEDEYD